MALAYAHGVSDIPLMAETIGTNLEKIAAHDPDAEALVRAIPGRDPNLAIAVADDELGLEDASALRINPVTPTRKRVRFIDEDDRRMRDLLESHDLRRPFANPARSAVFESEPGG